MNIMSLQSSNQKIDVCVFGGCHTDVTIKLRGAALMGRSNQGSTNVKMGGVAANIALFLSNFGATYRTTFIGAVSKDDEKVSGWLRDSNLNVKLIRVDAAQPRYTAILDQSGELVIGLADMGLYEHVLDKDVTPLLTESPHALIFDANFSSEVLSFLSLCMNVNTKIFAAGTSVEKVERLAPLLPRLDALVLNRAEACQLTGVNGGLGPLVVNLMRRMKRPDACVLVSDGSAKAALGCGRDIVFSSPPKVQLKDVNGAGDAMAAALYRTCLDISFAGDGLSLHHFGLLKLLNLALSAGSASAAGKGVA